MEIEVNDLHDMDIIKITVHLVASIYRYNSLVWLRNGGGK